MHTLRAVGLIVFNLAVTGAFVGVFLNQPDRVQPGVTLRWLLLYLVAVGHPLWWAVQHYRTFRRLEIAMDRDAYGLAWSPLYVGGTTLLIALTLL